MSGVRLDLHASDLKLAPGILRQSMRALEQTHNIPFGYSILKDIADQIEAQTIPPRIPEPGLWGVVEAKSRPGQTFPSRYVRRYDQGNAGYDWVTVNSAESSQSLRWSDLIDPVLIREGLS